jgi:hypothetical protein
MSAADVKQMVLPQTERIAILTLRAKADLADLESDDKG